MNDCMKAMELFLSKDAENDKERLVKALIDDRNIVPLYTLSDSGKINSRVFLSTMQTAVFVSKVIALALPDIAFELKPDFFHIKAESFKGFWVDVIE